MKAAIIGLGGPELTPDESALLQAFPPAGVILFGRNIEGALALTRLLGDVREVLPPGAVLMIDHEGGRVARLRPPEWRAHPTAASIGALYEADAASGLKLAWLTGALIGLDCIDVGFDVVCAPVLDLRAEGTTEAIGDRSYGSDPQQVAAVANSMADGLLSAGVQPVGKHAPGHGRARVDSHMELPVIGAETDLARDFQVFTQCAGLPWMMTAHIVYEGIDAARPATLSPTVIQQVIRGRVAFDGVLVSDDLAMHALSGPAGERARAAVGAGCDLALHCSGRLDEIEAVLRAVPDASRETRLRMARADSMADSCRLHLDRQALIADQDSMLT